MAIVLSPFVAGAVVVAVESVVAASVVAVVLEQPTLPNARAEATNTLAKVRSEEFAEVILM
ncbi:hypothetical protein BEN49_17880 [Hymenobacter coccineus]|uniref:Uncharacterized protein n=1 Tax=Hymenobacter coccineus TaxID=1908235 RepID=A0A1G1TM09_9BACT|nr:hypothetical protein BEN49_17880 [Hymenobacter coccineus]